MSARSSTSTSKLELLAERLGRLRHVGRACRRCRPDCRGPSPAPCPRRSPGPAAPHWRARRSTSSTISSDRARAHRAGGGFAARRVEPVGAVREQSRGRAARATRACGPARRRRPASPPRPWPRRRQAPWRRRRRRRERPCRRAPRAAPRLTSSTRSAATPASVGNSRVEPAFPSRSPRLSDGRERCRPAAWSTACAAGSSEPSANAPTHQRADLHRGRRGV